MTRICLRCIAITERVSGQEKSWVVSFEPAPTMNGDEQPAYARDGELTLRVFRESFARSFQVGEYYSSDLERIDAPR